MTDFPDGRGVAGRYLGLPDRLSDYESARIVVLPVPFDNTTTYQQGADRGPAALIEASRNLEVFDIENRAEVYRLGIHTAEAQSFDSSEEMLARTTARVLNCLADGKFVVTLGGEHSISLAAVRAHAEHFGKIGVLQLDAHSDRRDRYLGNPFSHASVMARIREIDNVSKIVAAGIRSMDSSEYLNDDGVVTFFDHEIHEAHDWITRLVAELPDKVYMTVDLDVLSPGLMPATGTPEPGGLEWYSLLKLVRAVCREKKLLGFDVVELCPLDNPWPDFVAAKLVYSVLSYRFGAECKLSLSAGKQG